MINLDLSMFGFVALWSPILMASIVFLVILKFYLSKQKNNLKKNIFFVTGMMLSYIFFGSPIDLLGHLIFSIHMVQMAGVYFIAIPFILYGLIDSEVDRLIFVIMKKVNALLFLGLFNIFFSLYHLPVIFDYVMTNKIVHLGIHFILVVSCFLMWYPIFYRKWNPIQKIGYLFANGVLLTPACALLIFSDRVIYSVFTNIEQWNQMMQLCVPTSILNTLNLEGPYFFQWISIIEDQHLGGVFMKIIQEIVLGVFIGYVFITGFREGRLIDKVEDIPLSSE